MYMRRVWKILSSDTQNLEQPVGLARVRQDVDLLQNCSGFRYFSINNEIIRRTELILKNNSDTKSKSKPYAHLRVKVTALLRSQLSKLIDHQS